MRPKKLSIAKREDALFQRWRKRHPRAVPDGLVDEVAYKSSTPRLVFVMKEVNNTPASFDLRDFLRTPTRRHSWDNVTRWITGIRKLNRDIPWEELEIVSLAHRARMLKSVGVMNLKKTPGGHTTQNKLLKKYARRDNDLLTEQLALYDPDIIICCGSTVAEIIDSIIDVDGHNGWKTTTRGISYRPFNGHGLILAYAHPEARVDDPLIYYGLVDAIRELRRKRSRRR